MEAMSRQPKFKIHSIVTRLNTAMLGIAVLILIGIVVLSYREWKQYRLASGAAIQSREILETANRLLLGVLDAETGQRGFLLTGEQRYLKPYDRAIEAVPAELANLNRLLARRQGQSGSTPQLNRLVEQKLAELRETIDLRRAQSAAQALNVVLSDRGRRLMDEIRGICFEIQDHEFAALIDAQRDGAAAARRAFLITAIGSLIVLSFFVVGNISINRAVVAREGALTDAQNARDSLKTTIASIGDAVISTDAKGRIVFANKVAHSLLRAPEVDVVGKHLDDVFRIVNEFTRAKVESPVTKVLREGAIVGLANHTLLIAQDGTEIPIDDSGAPIRGESGPIQGTVLVFRDVSERRRAEEKAGYLVALVESSEDAIIGKSLDGTIQSWNASAERLYGYRAEEIIGHHFSELVPAERKHEESDILEKLRGGERTVHFETVRLRKGGGRVDVSLTISPIRNKNGQIIGGSHVARDISEQKKSAENMRQTQKLESLGVLAGGVAHDFNNLLVGILGNASLALDQVEPNSRARAPLEGVIAASERAAQLTHQMLAYSGRGRFVLERINLSARIRETVPLIQAAIPRSVELRFDLEEDLPAIEADATQIQQLVMNIVINGAEAIPEETAGTVTITTHRQYVDEQYIRNQTEAGGELKRGEYVLFEVRDSGSGMDQTTKARIFDPFFTTKFTGRGLGLAAVLGIVRGHGGSIRVSSAPGQGTVFSVLFPAVEAELEANPRKQQDAGDLSGSGTVLVIDDEELVRGMAKQALEHYGYSVLLAEDGGRGVEAFRREADRIKCVVLDMTMPVMSGEETLARIRAVRSDIPVILSSGFNEVEAVRRFEGKGLAGFLQKPYQVATLAKTVKSVLGNWGAVAGQH